MKKTIFLLISFVLITTLVNAQYCNKYADKAVAQYKLAKQNNLPDINWPLWTDDWNGHFNWCKTVPHEVAEKEIAKRQGILDKYIKNGTKSISKSKQHKNNGNQSDNKKNPELNAVSTNVLGQLIKDQPKFKVMEQKNAVLKQEKVNPLFSNLPTSLKNTNLITLKKDEKFSIGHDLNYGSTVYSDRNFLYNDVPSELVGLDYLITRNNDKFTSGDHFFTIKDPRETTVYIAIDPKITPPSWLIKYGYTQTYKKIKFWIPDSNKYLSFNIYKKNFNKGETMVFGGNQNAKNQKQCGMYLVFFSEKIQASIDLKKRYGNSVSGIGVIKVKKVDVKDGITDNLKSETKTGEDIKNNKICSTQTRKLNGNNTTLFILNEERDKQLFPGNILSIADIEAGKYAKTLTPSRKPYTISTFILGKNNPTVKVADATTSEYLKARNKLLDFNFEMGPKISVGEYKAVESSVDFAVKASGSFRYMFYSGSASAAYEESNKKNHYMVSITKLYYSVNFTPDPNKGNQNFFKNPNIPNNPDWVYVSNVQYGTRLILDIASDYSKEKVETALGFKAEGGLFSGSGETSVEYQNIRKNLKIKVIAVGEQSGIENLLNNTIIKPAAFAKAFAENKITKYTQIYPLSYTLKYVDGNETAQVQTYANYKQSKCRKMSQFMRFEFQDIYVVNSNDESGGEDLRGWMKIKPWGYGEKTIFNQKFQENVEGGDFPIKINNQIYYFKYSGKGLDDPKKYLEIEAYLMEDDDGSAADDFGHPTIRIKLKDIFSGMVYENEELKMPKVWKSIPLIHPCNDCLVIPFSDDGSKVLIRFKIDLLDKLPQGAKIGF